MRHWVRAVLEDICPDVSSLPQHVVASLSRLIQIVEAQEQHHFRTSELEVLADRLWDCENLHDLLENSIAAARLTGFDDVTIVLLSSGGLTKNMFRVLTSHSKNWINRYIEKSYQYVDPAVIRAMTREGVILFEDLDKSTPIACDFWNDAAAHGVGQNGFSYVASKKTGAKVSVSFVSNSSEKEVASRLRLDGADLLVLSEIISECFLSLTCGEDIVGSDLSEEEIRVLRYLATFGETGLSDWAKSNSLDIRRIQPSILAKLEVCSLYQAVAIAGSKRWFDGLSYRNEDTISQEPIETHAGLAVTSRVIVDPLPEEVGALALPVLECCDGRSPFQDGLRELAVVEVDVA